MGIEIVQEINRYIQKEGITQKELATRVKVNPSIISRILKGKQTGMNLKTYDKIMDVLKETP